MISSAFSRLLVVATLLLAVLNLCAAWSQQSVGPSTSTTTSPQTTQQSRRAFVASTTASSIAAAAALLLQPAISNAFDGSGSSSYAGRTPLEKAAKAKGYKERIAKDVRDFNRLGAAIAAEDLNVAESEAWIGFFITFQRREPDAVGRTYAALLDLIGVEKNSGGAALLLAGTFAKQGKPPQSLKQYKLAVDLFDKFDPIKAAAKSGDAGKTKKEYSKAATALSAFLESVEMPADLSDPLYK